MGREEAVGVPARWGLEIPRSEFVFIRPAISRSFRSPRKSYRPRSRPRPRIPHFDYEDEDEDEDDFGA